MGITTQNLMKERFVLQKTFNELNSKIQHVEKEVTSMKANLSAVHGALQQMDKLIKMERVHKVDGPGKASLEIEKKQEAELLNEGDK